MSDPSPRRWGIFGGTFDPVHKGHIHIANQAVDLLQLEKLIVIPTSQNPLKPGPGSNNLHRLFFAEQLVAAVPQASLYDYELKSARDGQPSFTVDTVRRLQTDLADQGNSQVDLMMLLGVDSFATLAKWKEPLRLLSLVSVCVYPRPGYSVELAIESALDALEAKFGICYDQGSEPNTWHIQLKPTEQADQATGASDGKDSSTVVLLNGEAPDISSTDLRQMVNRDEMIDPWVPHSVANYISQHNLYRDL